jgi:hypothetical protein
MAGSMPAAGLACVYPPAHPHPGATPMKPSVTTRTSDSPFDIDLNHK